MRIKNLKFWICYLLSILVAGLVCSQIIHYTFAQTGREIEIPDVKWPDPPSKKPKLTEHGRDIPLVPFADLPSGAAEQFQLLAINDFSGGLNIEGFKTQLKPNQALELENALFKEDGSIYKRPGYDYYGGLHPKYQQYDSIGYVVLNVYAKKRGNLAYIVDLQLDTPIPQASAIMYPILQNSFATFSETSYFYNIVAGDTTWWRMGLLDSIRTKWTKFSENHYRMVQLNYSVLGVVYECGEATCTTFCLPDGQDSCRWYDSTYFGDSTSWNKLDDYPSYGSDRAGWHSAEDDTGADVFIVTYADSTSFEDSTITKVILQTRMRKYGNSHPCTTSVNTGLWISDTPYRYSSDFVLPTNWESGGVSHPESVFVAEWSENPNTESSWSHSEIWNTSSYNIVPRADVAGDIVIDEMWVQIATYKEGEFFRNYYKFPDYFAASGGSYEHCNCAGDLWACIDTLPCTDGCTLYFDRGGTYSSEVAFYDSLGEEWDSISADLDPEHVCASEPFNFLYRYTQQDGDKYLMAGTDTALYYLSDYCFEYITGTEGTSGKWDGTTFEDLFVYTHEGITPGVWDGENIKAVGTSVDSFQVMTYGWNYPTDTLTCDVDSGVIYFDPNATGWTSNEWIAYTLEYQHDRQELPSGGVNPDRDTVARYDLIIANSESKIWLRCGSWELDVVIGDYAKIHSWFSVDTVWREGRVDATWSIGRATDADYGTFIQDSSFSWDSTFTYSDYVFEVTAGKGLGSRCYMVDYLTDDNCDASCLWNTTGFHVWGFSKACFDTTTYYRIYRPSFWEGSKLVENFDGRLWFGWTGTGDEQNKNHIVYIELNDLGNFPPENSIILESDDGDWITGMSPFYVDQAGFKTSPFHELIATKNNSLYKIVPTSTAGVYDFYYITKGVGCVSNLAIASAEGRFLIFPDQTGVYSYNGNMVQNISKNLKPIFGGWNQPELEACAGVYNPEDRHYYLSYPDTSQTENSKTIAMRIDMPDLPWSKETILARAWAYQPDITDTVKTIYADIDSPLVWWYGSQADDDTTGVVLTYQTRYEDFQTYPIYDKWIGFAAIEAELDTGWVYLDWYRDYSVLAYSDSFQCGLFWLTPTAFNAETIADTKNNYQRVFWGKL